MLQNRSLVLFRSGPLGGQTQDGKCLFTLKSRMIFLSSVHVLCVPLLMSSHQPLDFGDNFKKTVLKKKKPWHPASAGMYPALFCFAGCWSFILYLALGADSRVHCCSIGKHHSPSQSDQQDGSVASWVGEYFQKSIVIIRIHIYVCIYINVLLFTYTYIPFCVHFRCRLLAQDVYIAALEPLEMPSDARSFVIQVLTTSGPAPDALVVPVVDESYDVPWLVGGGMSWGSFEDEFLNSKWIHVPWCFAHLQGSAV